MSWRGQVKASKHTGAVGTKQCRREIGAAEAWGRGISAGETLRARGSGLLGDGIFKATTLEQSEQRDWNG